MKIKTPQGPNTRQERFGRIYVSYSASVNYQSTERRPVPLVSDCSASASSMCHYGVVGDFSPLPRGRVRGSRTRCQASTPRFLGNAENESKLRFSPTHRLHVSSCPTIIGSFPPHGFVSEASRLQHLSVYKSCQESLAITKAQ